MEKSDTGFLVLCQTCEQQSATIFDGILYYCKNCYEKPTTAGNRKETEENDAMKCECGADSVGGIHSSWCGKYEK
ncbi:hypothetical protein HYV49_01030 [Candidatus Pacearchaeota archaeon]|nr:hypothetical protein [Candidatus Pacearchaeota archaeon]